jgi:hypothetical protein
VRSAVIVNSLLSLVYIGLFSYVTQFSHLQIKNLELIIKDGPLYIQRYSGLLMSYAVLRERIINNGTDARALGFRLNKKEEVLEGFSS